MGRRSHPREPCPPGTSFCTKCEQVKPAIEFHHMPRKLNGLSSWCRTCAVNRTREWRSQHRTELRERQKATYAADVERERARARERYATDPRVRIHLATYAANHPHVTRMARARRKVRKTGNGVFRILERDWRRALHRYRNGCAYCGAQQVRLDREHVIPIVRGGRHSIGNLLPACQSCNARKATRLLIEWKSAA